MMAHLLSLTNLRKYKQDINPAKENLSMKSHATIYGNALAGNSMLNQKNGLPNS